MFMASRTWCERLSLPEPRGSCLERHQRRALTRPAWCRGLVGTLAVAAGEIEMILTSEKQGHALRDEQKLTAGAGTRARMHSGFVERLPAPTPVSAEALDVYLSELASSKPLARHEELAVAQAIDAARNDAFDALLSSGVRLPMAELLLAELEDPERSSSPSFDIDDAERTSRGALLDGVRRWVRFEHKLAGLAKRLEVRALAPDARARSTAEMIAVRSRRNRLILRLPLSRSSRIAMIEDFEKTLRPFQEAEARALRLSSDLGLGEREIRARVRNRGREDQDDLRRAFRSLAEARERAREAERALGCPPAALAVVAAHVHQARAREQSAKTTLLTANLRLVVAFARKYKGRGVPMADLIQEGNMGLMIAVDKFDHRAGTKLSTYASWWLRQAMQRAVINQGRTVRVPVHVAVSAAITDRARQRMAQELGRDPEPEELSKLMGVSRADLDKSSAHRPASVSLQQPIGEDGRMELGDVLADETASDPQHELLLSDRREHARHAMGSLTPREQFVVSMRFGLDGRRSHTLREIGRVLGCTRERVRQIEAKALKRMRQAMLGASI